jgi:hypothetical protein
MMEDGRAFLKMRRFFTLSQFPKLERVLSGWKLQSCKHHIIAKAGSWHFELLFGSKNNFPPPASFEHAQVIHGLPCTADYMLKPL